jgi:triosephosphate isomerase
MYFSAAQTNVWTKSVMSQIAPLDSVQKSSIELFVLPSTPMITQVISTFIGSGIRVGSQNHAASDFGAFTGETSAIMLSEIGCEFAEVGHAERRNHFNESNELISRKVKQALAARLVPIICVGEESQMSAEAASEICIEQIKSAISLSSAYLHQRIIIAYEPIWAIGVAEPADTSYINLVCAKIRAASAIFGTSNLQILYGGSADRGLFEKIAQNVDGLFLGRSAHDVKNLKEIIEEVGNISLEPAK